MDDILNLINPFGRYQKLNLVLIGFTSILVSMPIYSSIFTLASPELICFNKTYKDTNLKNLKDVKETCEIWSNLNRSNNNEYECKFDTEYYGLTIINEWKLVCDKQFLAKIPQTVYMVGTFSCFGIGFFSDKFGRRTIMLFLIIFLSVNLSLAEFFQLSFFKFSIQVRFAIFTLSNFLTGCLIASIYSVSIVLALESTTKNLALWQRILVYICTFLASFVYC